MKKHKIAGYGRSSWAGKNTAISDAYRDFRKSLREQGSKLFNNQEEIYDVLTFMDFKLADSLFNNRFKKHKKVATTVSFRDQLLINQINKKTFEED